MSYCTGTCYNVSCPGRVLCHGVSLVVLIKSGCLSDIGVERKKSGVVP